MSSRERVESVLKACPDDISSEWIDAWFTSLSDWHLERFFRTISQEDSADSYEEDIQNMTMVDTLLMLTFVNAQSYAWFTPTNDENERAFFFLLGVKFGAPNVSGLTGETLIRAVDIMLTADSLTFSRVKELAIAGIDVDSNLMDAVTAGGTRHVV